jgi:hypothetical protein
LDSDTLRIQLTCNDMLWGAVPTIVRAVSTGIVLMAAAAGLLDTLDLTLDDPVGAMHDLSEDYSALIQLASGQQLSATDLHAEFSPRLWNALPQLREVAPELVRQAMRAWTMD